MKAPSLSLLITSNHLLDVYEVLAVPSSTASMGEYFLEFLTCVAEQPTWQHNGYLDYLKMFLLQKGRPPRLSFQCLFSVPR